MFDDESDAKLIGYLARHNHWTPFGHPQAQFRITVPVFVARQIRTSNIGVVRNEVSRRYVSDEPEFFVPDSWRGAPTDGAKQGSSGGIGDPGWATNVKLIAEQTAKNAYTELLELGVAPEQARMVLPQTMYTSWIETGSLAYYARFCGLRLDPHAQYEIRQVAQEIATEMAEVFPVSWAALMEAA